MDRLKRRSFVPDLVARFTDRPNRYIVTASADGNTVTAHCPNPGRLRELLLPGRRIALERSDSPGRKTGWTLAAGEYDGMWIPLVSVRANALAGDLVLPRLFPEAAARPERMLGSSRIDWLVEDGIRRSWVEVKACTLVEHGRAMFPDAPSARAVRHVRELSALTDRDRGVVLFTVMNPKAEVFSPNPHTDPDFCRALSEASSRGTLIKAVSIRTDADGWSEIAEDDLPIDFSTYVIAARDRGVLIRVWETEKDGLLRWIVSIDRCAEKLGAALRHRAPVPSGSAGVSGRLAATLPVRGNPALFDSLESELSAVNPAGPSGGNLWSVDPIKNRGFLDLLLEYRHERVIGA